MISQALENLVKTGSLKSEPASQGEFNGLLRSDLARARAMPSTAKSRGV
jgi:hypothetical protein